MKTIISTEKSFLNIYQYENKLLVKSCIEDIKNKLIERPEIQVYGKICYQNRSIGFFSNESIGYNYSNQMIKSQNLTSNLNELLNSINIIFNSAFNSILINYYKDGNDNIGNHSDNEKCLDKIGVVSLSYGAIRKFRIKDKITKKTVVNIPTENLSIIHMGGEFQKEFTHSIPVEKKIKDDRWSFTFRKHLY
tara:strand:+ start:12149 stop:12724 length:576 start_codon:yes stop_codon:yes gene_type:complete